MIFKNILAIDPSGNFEEGKGTTGACIYDIQNHEVIEIFTIQAVNFTSKEDYWQAHLDRILVMRRHYKDLIVVMEDFMLDPNRAMQQSYSKMETPKLIGIVQNFCYARQVPYFMQRAAEVKKRWSDKILLHKEIIQKVKHNYYLNDSHDLVNGHCRDAIRHAVHFAYFRNKEETNVRLK